MKYILILSLFILSSCASSTRILEADAECYPYTDTKEEYRDCLRKNYEEFQQDVEETKSLILNNLSGK